MDTEPSVPEFENNVLEQHLRDWKSLREKTTLLDQLIADLQRQISDQDQGRWKDPPE